MFIKRIAQLAIAGAILSSSMAVAGQLDSGFYAGVEGARDNATFRERTNVGNGAVNFKDNDGAGNGAVTALFGYRYMVDGWHMGTEIYATKSFVRHDLKVESDESTDEREEFKHYYGISFTPGFSVNDSTVVYGVLGYVRARMDVKTDFLSQLTNPESHDKTISGVRVGLGLETSVYDNLSLRFQYAHSRFRSTTIRSNNSQHSTRFRPLDDIFSVGLVYSFM